MRPSLHDAKTRFRHITISTPPVAESGEGRGKSACHWIVPVFGSTATTPPVEGFTNLLKTPATIPVSATGRNIEVKTLGTPIDTTQRSAPVFTSSAYIVPEGEPV